MLNDVHPPPLEPQENGPAIRRSVGGRRRWRGDRAHSLEKTADHGMGTNLVFSDPEDRGDSFNTTMSAIIVGGVLLTVAIVVWLMWK